MHVPGAQARHSRLLMALLLLGGCALRLTGLEVHSLWFDEAQMVWTATTEDLWGVLRQDRHPPLSFLAFRVWAGLFGTGDGVLRLLPALVSCLALLLFTRTAGRLLSAPATLTAAGIFALAPFHVWYAQELRMYFLVEAGAVLALWGVERLRRERDLAGGAAVAAGCALAMGSHYFGCLAAVVAVAWVLPDLRRDSGCVLRTFAAAAAGCIVWVPWMVAFVPDQLDAPWGFYFRLSLRDLAELPVRHFLIHLRHLPPSLVYAVAVLVWLGLGTCVLKAVRPGDLAARRLILSIVLPLGALLSLFLVMPPNFQPQYMIALAPGMALAVASGLHRVTALHQAARVLPWLLLVLCAVASLVLRRGNLKEDYRTAVHELASAWRPGDVVVAVTGTPEGPSQAGVRHYLRGHPQILAAVRDLDTVLASLEAGEFPDGRVHAIYRVREYARHDLESLRGHLRQVHTGPERFWIQHLVFVR